MQVNFNARTSFEPGLYSLALTAGGNVELALQSYVCRQVVNLSGQMGIKLGCRDMLNSRLQDPVHVFHKTDEQWAQEDLSHCSLRWLMIHRPEAVTPPERVCCLP